MACTKATAMRFRVYTMLPLFGASVHDEKYHVDTGKEFTITHPEDTIAWSKAYYSSYSYGDITIKNNATINDYSIAFIMLNKLYGFEGRFLVGWRVDRWMNRFLAGSISDHFYIKRIT